MPKGKKITQKKHKLSIESSSKGSPDLTKSSSDQRKSKKVGKKTGTKKRKLLIIESSSTS